MGSANCAEAGPGKTKPSASAATMNQEAVAWLGLTWWEICHLVILCVSLFYRLKRKSAAHRIIKLGTRVLRGARFGLSQFVLSLKPVPYSAPITDQLAVFSRVCALLSDLFTRISIKNSP